VGETPQSHLFCVNRVKIDSYKYKITLTSVLWEPMLNEELSEQRLFWIEVYRQGKVSGDSPVEEFTYTCLIVVNTQLRTAPAQHQVPYLR
jgi:hypothetical protein